MVTPNQWNGWISFSDITTSITWLHRNNCSCQIIFELPSRYFNPNFICSAPYCCKNCLQLCFHIIITWIIIEGGLLFYRIDISQNSSKWIWWHVYFKLNIIRSPMHSIWKFKGNTFMMTKNDSCLKYSNMLVILL